MRECRNVDPSCHVGGVGCIVHLILHEGRNRRIIDTSRSVDHGIESYTTSKPWVV
jgi:hypothetical protein